MRYIKYIVETGQIVGETISASPPVVAAGQSYLEVEPDTPSDPFLYWVVDGAVELRAEPIVPPVEPAVYSFNEWVDRFPPEAQVAIASAAMTHPVAKLIYDRAMASAYIDPADPRTIDSLNILVALEVISRADADAAIAAP